MRITVKTSTPTYALAFLLLIVTANADAQGVLSWQEAMFNNMINSNAPTAHMGQRRGVFSGGGIVARTPQMNQSFIHMVPPSFEAGCGGINLYGGSFSFINKEQMTQLMRSVAANAVSYAFKLALDSMCANCGQVIENLQKKIQALNSLMANSCQLGQGIVTDVVAAMDSNQKVGASEKSLVRGIGDVFESFTAVTGDSPIDQVTDNLPAEVSEEITGNLVWRVIVDEDLASSPQPFNIAANDNFPNRMLMGLTGTIVIRPAENAPDGEGKNFPVRVYPKITRVVDYLYGNAGGSTTTTVESYNCDTYGADGCLTMTVVTATNSGWGGQISYVRDQLIGANGLIPSLLAGTDPSEQVKRLMESAPNGVIAGVGELARIDPGIAARYAEAIAPHIALELTSNLFTRLQTVVASAAATIDHSYAKQLQTQIAEARRELEAESLLIRQRIGSEADLLRQYKTYMDISSGTVYVDAEK